METETEKRTVRDRDRGKQIKREKTELESDTDKKTEREKDRGEDEPG